MLDPSAHIMQGFEEISFADSFPEINPRDHGWDCVHSSVVFNTVEAIASSTCGSSGVHPVEHCDHLSTQASTAANEDLTDDEYLICSPTVPAFCLSDKSWGEIRR